LLFMPRLVTSCNSRLLPGWSTLQDATGLGRFRFVCSAFPPRSHR
jgi:hypothetical protein